MNKFSIDNLRRLIGNFSFEENSIEWIVKTRPYGSFPSLNIKIDKKDFLKRVDELRKYNFEDFYLYKKDYTYFEHPVRIVRKEVIFHEGHPYEIDNLRFEVGNPTENYSLFLGFSRGLDPYHQQVLKINLGKLALIKSDISFQEFIDIINKILKLKTLVIRSTSILDNNEFLRLAKSYLFYVAYTRNSSISLRTNLEVYSRLVPLSYYYYGKYIINQDLNEELVDYYKRGVASEDPFIQFISFYHIMEYFYEIVFEEFKTRKVDKNEGFKGKGNELKNIVKNKNLNEKKKLFLVLLKFIELDELKEQLDVLGKDFYTHLTNDFVKFANAKPVNEENFHETLADRIYTIRNALVHRKENHKEKYLPYKTEHKEELKMEIPIIKAITTQIILENSKTATRGKNE